MSERTDEPADPVEAALRRTLAERAHDVTWDPRLVPAAAAAAPRRVPPAVAWLSAAAAAVLVVGGVSLAAGGPGRDAAVDPGRSRSFSLPVAPTTGYVPQWESCEQAWSRGAVQATASPAPFLKFRPVPPSTSYAPPVPESTATDGQVFSSTVAVPAPPTDVVPPLPTDVPVTTFTNEATGVPQTTLPDLGGSGLPAPGGSGSSTQTPLPTYTGTEPVPPTLTGAPGPAPTLQMRIPRTEAELTASGLLGQVLDTSRFAGFSVGPARDELTVHVVRGPSARAAKALVASCAMRGVRLRTDLVTWSDGQLGAVVSEASRMPELAQAGASVSETNYDLNRAVVYVQGRLTAGAKAAIRARYGDSIAVVSSANGEVWKPSAP